MEKESTALVKVAENYIEKLSEEAKKFYNFHGAQMIGSEFPEGLIETLYLKLSNEDFDAGESFEIADNQQAESFEVRATKHIPIRGNVFLIDHALTFRYPQLREVLRQNPQILERLESMLKYQVEKKAAGEGESSPREEELELDNMDLIDVSSLEFPKNLITLSLVNNRLESAEELLSKLQYLNLRVLWLNGNPVAETEQMQSYVDSKSRIELFNSKFTKHTTDWGIKYAHYRSYSAATSSYNGKVYSLDLDDRNIFILNPAIFDSFTNLHSISLRGHSPANQDQLQVFIRILTLPSLRSIYVDEEVEVQLRKAVLEEKTGPAIMERVLINKHSFKRELLERDERLDAIVNKIFRLAGCYRLASAEQLDESSCWYVNDEVGSLIPHSDNPKVKLMPFLYAPNFKLDDKVISYTLMWPLEELNEGDEVTRDYLNSIKQSKQRSSRMAAWQRLAEDKHLSLIQDYDLSMLKTCADSVALLEKFYNQNANAQRQLMGKIQFSENKLGVISDYQFVNKYLSHERFEVVTELEKADILWLTGACEEEEWANYKGKYLLNQFPFESCIVMKQNLAETVQSVLGETKFLMRTYNLEKELPLFIGDYYQREKEEEDNLWIIKPPNMARSIDMLITDNLPLVIRSMETGPKIAQKYISKPVLLKGKKVDLRYVLLVKSIEPLNLFLYKNFWIRSANNDYTTDRRHLSTYETQFTVMNYGEVSDFKQINYHDFIADFEQEYELDWKVINEKIKKMLRNVFIAVGTKYPHMHDEKSRAVYGIDIMIDSETMEPKLLEITFSPDCKRACENYPSFYNDVFQTLFLETMSDNMERII